MRPQALLFGAVAIATAVYPLIVYNGIQQLGPSVLSVILFFLLLGRVVLRGEYHQPEQYVQLVLVGGLCLFAAWQKSELALRLYPVAMSLGFACFFAISLRAETTLIERFASVFVKDIEEHQRQYMRGLTVWWAVLLLLNAAVAAYTAYCLSLSQWTLYNGAIAYIVFGVFTLCELINRHFYKKRHERRLQQSTNDGA